MNAMNLLNCRPVERPGVPCPVFPRGRRPEAHRPRPRAMDRVLRPAPFDGGVHRVHGGTRRCRPVLPMATGIVPWLTPLAAVGLGTIVLMATGFHLRADERVNALETGLWASIAAVIAIGRWHLVAASHADAAPWVLVAALGVPGTCGHHQSHRALQPPCE